MSVGHKVHLPYCTTILFDIEIDGYQRDGTMEPNPVGSPRD